MNHDEFIAKLKELVCYADWHHRYYSQRARKYKRIHACLVERRFEIE
jgi:hypothetical protein